MVTKEAEIRAAGAEIVWVLERDEDRRPGTAQRCRDTLDTLGSVQGWCVGDAQTIPVPYAFDDSPLASGRGFDIIVERQTMEILWATTHGTTGGNENLSADELLTAVQEAVARVRQP